MANSSPEFIEEIRTIRYKQTPPPCSDVEDGEIIDINPLHFRRKLKKRRHHHRRHHHSKIRKISEEEYFEIGNEAYSEIDSYVRQETEEYPISNSSSNLIVVTPEEKASKNDYKNEELHIPLNVLKDKKRHRHSTEKNEVNNIELDHSKNDKPNSNNKYQLDPQKFELLQDIISTLNEKGQSSQSSCDTFSDLKVNDKKIHSSSPSNCSVGKVSDESSTSNCLDLKKINGKIEDLTPTAKSNNSLEVKTPKIKSEPESKPEAVKVETQQHVLEVECKEEPSKSLLPSTGSPCLDIWEDYFCKRREFREAFKQEVEGVRSVCQLLISKNERLTDEINKCVVEIFQDKRQHYERQLEKYKEKMKQNLTH